MFVSWTIFALQNTLYIWWFKTPTLALLSYITAFNVRPFTACPSTAAMNLTDLEEGITCVNLASCTGFTCCMDVDRLARSIEITFDFNPCSNVLEIKVEKMEEKIYMSDFDFGM